MGNSESHIKISGVTNAAFFNHNSNNVVVVTKNTLQYFSTNKAIQKTIVTQRKSNVCCVAYAQDEDMVITADDDLRIRIYSASSGDFRRTIPDDKDPSAKQHRHTDTIRCLYVLPHDRLLSGSADGTVKLWNLKSSEKISTLPQSNNGQHMILPSVTSISYDLKRNLVFAGGADGVTRGFDMDSGRLLIEYRGHGKGCILSLAVSVIADILLSSCMDGTIKLWDIDNGREMGTYKYFANCLIYDHMRDIMFAGNDHGFFAILQVLNAGPGKGEIRKIKSLEFHRSSILTMNYNKYSDTLITTSTDNTVGIAPDVTQIPFNSATHIVPTAELTQVHEDPKDDFPPEVLDSIMEELKDPVPDDAVDVSQFLEIEEKLLSLCLQLFDDQDELMKYKRSKLADSFNATKYQLAKSMTEAQKHIGSLKRELWDEKWPVIDSTSGISALQESHKARKEELLERHRKEIEALEEHCNGELEEFKMQLPLEKKHAALRYKAAKEEYQQTASAAQSLCIGALRGMLGSTFPIIRNRYQIGSLISPNSASVFKGVDLQTMELVAIKAFPPHGVTLNTTLAHDTLVPIIDVCATPASMYVVMKMMPNTLYSYVKSQGDQLVPLDTVKEYLHTLLSSLVFLHNHSLVIRDLRPSGVLVGGNNRPYLIHLGVMRALLGDAESEPPENGMVYGAPEIFGRVVNTASDIWSLGCIFLFLMQTEEERLMPIFYGSDPASILETMIQLIGRPTIQQLDDMAIACNMAEDGSELLKYIGEVPILPNSLSTKEQLSKLCCRADDASLDLLLEMLKFIPSDRILAEQALRHKYFDGFTPSPSSPSPHLSSSNDFIPIQVDGDYISNHTTTPSSTLFPEVAYSDTSVVFHTLDILPSNANNTTKTTHTLIHGDNLTPPTTTQNTTLTIQDNNFNRVNEEDETETY